MIKVHNDTTNGYFIMMTLPYMDEIIIITIVMAIWVFSIMQFFRFVYLLYQNKYVEYLTEIIPRRQWSEWLIPAPSCEPFYWSETRETNTNYDNSSRVSLQQPASQSVCNHVIPFSNILRALSGRENLYNRPFLEAGAD